MIALIFWIMEVFFCIVADLLLERVHIFDSLPSAMLIMAFAIIPALMMEAMFAGKREE